MNGSPDRRYEPSSSCSPSCPQCPTNETQEGVGSSGEETRPLSPGAESPTDNYRPSRLGNLLSAIRTTQSVPALNQPLPHSDYQNIYSFGTPSRTTGSVPDRLASGISSIQSRERSAAGGRKRITSPVGNGVASSFEHVTSYRSPRDRHEETETDAMAGNGETRGSTSLGAIPRSTRLDFATAEYATPKPPRRTVAFAALGDVSPSSENTGTGARMPDVPVAGRNPLARTPRPTTLHLNPAPQRPPWIPYESANPESHPRARTPEYPPQTGAFLSNNLLIQSIEPFKTGDDIALDAFLSTFEHAARMNNWTAAQKFDAIQLKLRGEALRVCKIARCANWEQVVARLKARYGSREIRAITRRKVAQCCQGPNEDVLSFAERLRGLLTKLHPEQDGTNNTALREVLSETLLDKFCEGLRPSLRRAVLSKTPESFEKACEVAMLEEQLDALEIRTANIHLADAERQVAKRPRPEPLTSDSAQPRAGPNRDNRPARDDARAREVPPPARQGNCHRCGQEGHWAAECNLPRTDIPRDSRIICWQCGERGHIRAECPENQRTARPDFRNRYEPNQQRRQRFGRREPNRQTYPNARRE